MKRETESIPAPESGAKPIQNYLRRWARKTVNLPARLEIVLDEDGRKFTTGSAIVRNISFKGALLGRVVLKKAVLPAKRFSIHLAFNLRKYKGIGAIARPVHFGSGKEFELGIEFIDLWIKSQD
jgi:hypothetical protein